MTKRIRRLVVAVAALAALALGGGVLAQAQTSPSGAPERTTMPDRDNVQSGDQTTPDTATTATGRARHHTVRVASSTTAGPAGGGTGQSGDQIAPDTGSASETPGAESPEPGAGLESASANDGPGGHADPPGNANADHQFQGNE